MGCPLTKVLERVPLFPLVDVIVKATENVTETLHAAPRVINILTTILFALPSSACREQIFPVLVAVTVGGPVTLTETPLNPFKEQVFRVA